MPSIASLKSKLSKDFPDISFVEGGDFLWSPAKNTIFYNSSVSSSAGTSLLLHELGHALLEHSSYSRDVALLAMENDAWDRGREVALSYGLSLDDDFIQDHLDTYRDWMHSRSTCPACSATGFQVGEKEYSCPACSQKWRVNEARVCGLRRYKIDNSNNKKSPA